MEKTKTLEGVKIVLTRSLSQSAQAVELFSSRGADVLLFPAIEIRPATVVPELHRLADDFSPIDFIIFTSVNSVKYFYEYREKHGLKLNLADAVFVSVGAKTALSLKEHYAGKVFIPESFDSAALLRELKNEYTLKNKTVLLPCSDLARNELPDALEVLGADVIRAVVYKNVIPDKIRLPELIGRLEQYRDAYFIFTSPSVFNNFINLTGIAVLSEYFNQKKVVAIGPVTKNEMENHGLKDIMMPETATMEGICGMIENLRNSSGK